MGAKELRTFQVARVFKLSKGSIAAGQRSSGLSLIQLSNIHLAREKVTKRSYQLVPVHQMKLDARKRALRRDMLPHVQNELKRPVS
jgi:hypothetical protein